MSASYAPASTSPPPVRSSKSSCACGCSVSTASADVASVFRAALCEERAGASKASGGSRAARLGGAGGRGMGGKTSGSGNGKTKKPPGGPGGFLRADGDDAGRRGQRHEFIMHTAGKPTMSDAALLLCRVKLGRE